MLIIPTIITAVAMLATQLLIIWIQPLRQNRINAKISKRDNIYKCFEDLAGLLATRPSPKNVSLFTQADRDSYDKESTDKWFYAFSALEWRLKRLLGNDHPELVNAFDELCDFIMKIYDLQQDIHLALLLEKGGCSQNKVNLLYEEKCSIEHELTKVHRKFEKLSYEAAKKFDKI